MIINESYFRQIGQIYWMRGLGVNFVVNYFLLLLLYVFSDFINNAKLPLQITSWEHDFGLRWRQ